MCFDLGLPEIKRCCFCIPLRYGLIVWGYVTLIINCMFLFWHIKKIDKKLTKDNATQEYKDDGVFSESLELMSMIVDMLLVILFVVAAHLKNVRLLKISYIGNLTSVIIYTLWNVYMIWTAVQLLHFMSLLSSDKSAVNSLYWTMTGVTVVAAIEILIKCYIMFLLRKEIKKLEANCVFSFVNNVAEAKCKMESEVDVEQGMFQPIRIDEEKKGLEEAFEAVTETIVPTYI